MLCDSETLKVFYPYGDEEDTLESFEEDNTGGLTLWGYHYHSLSMKKGGTASKGWFYNRYSRPPTPYLF